MNRHTKPSISRRTIPLLAIVTAFVTTGLAQADEEIAQYTQKGELIRPTGYREWIYVGAPLTPNDMNDGKAAFPEFHNVYIDRSAWRHWQKTGEFKEGTVILKELVSVGAKKSFSGNGYFMGDFQGLEAMVKDSKRFTKEPGQWGFFRFTTDDPKTLKAAATAMPAAECASCHGPNAQQDMIFVQHYPVLRAAKPGMK